MTARSVIVRLREEVAFKAGMEQVSASAKKGEQGADQGPQQADTAMDRLQAVATLAEAVEQIASANHPRRVTRASGQRRPH